MFWVPVMFICFTQGQCQFIYDKPELTEKICVKVLSDIGDKANKHPEVAAWKATCIPVSDGKAISYKFSYSF